MANRSLLVNVYMYGIETLLLLLTVRNRILMLKQNILDLPIIILETASGVNILQYCKHLRVML